MNIDKLTFDKMCFISILSPTKEMITIYKRNTQYDKPLKSFINMLSHFTNTEENYERLSRYVKENTPLL